MNYFEVTLTYKQFQPGVVIKIHGDECGDSHHRRSFSHDFRSEEHHSGIGSLSTPHSIVAMSDLVSASIARERFALTWLGVLAVIALLLASVGVYSVISHVTAQRTREVGIRLALGAQTGDVLKLMVRHGMILALIGVAIGLAGALALTRLIPESVVWGDPQRRDDIHQRLGFIDRCSVASELHLGTARDED